MIYYPKSKILEGQFTSGKDFTIKLTKKPYIGFYFALSNNTFFTGKNFYNSNSQELEKIDVSKLKDTIKLPIPFFVSPTEQDYKVGYITRYFMMRRNGDFTTIKEISFQDFDTFNSDDLYKTTTLKWKITGSKDEVENTNKTLVELKKPGFDFGTYFTNYSQFLK